MPIGNRQRDHGQRACGTIARTTPPPAIRASATVTARMAPTRAASGAAAGANTPMPITGIAPSRPPRSG